MINGFTEIFYNYTKLTKNEAYKIFNSLKQKNTILNSNWDDEVWLLNDETQEIHLYFSKFKAISSYDKDTLNYLYEEAKIFTCYLFNKLSLQTIQSILNDIIKVLNNDLQSSPTSINNIEYFFSSIDGFDDCLERLDEYQNTNFINGKRDLAAFETYFLFDELLNRYWKESNDEAEKLFYAPIYLWWNITTIFPTRPKEFIVTSRNCLEIRENKYHLKLRKTKLKGSKNKHVAYSINEDYEEYDSIIPDNLGKEIEWYIDKTKDYPSTSINSLFVLPTHYNKFCRSIAFNNRYLTYANFQTIFRLFYSEIIEKKYHYKVLCDRTISHLNPGEIQIIRMGDARHIALINIIAEGGTPLTAMYLAGHSNPTMSAHYFSNITTLIECKTYRLYRGHTEYQISINEPIKTRNYIDIEDGRCYNEGVVNRHDYKDCLYAVGKYGEIGFCKRCVYFRGEKTIEYKEELQKASLHFLKLIDQYRKGKGSKETIIEELLNIQNKADNYQKFLIEEEKWEEKE